MIAKVTAACDRSHSSKLLAHCRLPRETIQCRARPDINSAVQNGGRREDVFIEIVHGTDLPLRVGADYRADLDLVFANPDGTPLMPNFISATVSRICKRLGLPKGVSLHTVRHTHASLLLEEGAGLATISERMGHSSVRTTADIYSHAIRGKDREVAEMWDKIMQPAREASRSKVVN
jgi:integrase